MKILKKFVCCLLLVLFVVSSIQPAYATMANITESEYNISYKKVLESKGFTGNYESVDLYNQNDVKQWRMYYDNASYIILDRGTGKVMEFGYDGQNPYYQRKESKLYFCGPLAYFVESADKSNKKFYRLGENQYYDTLPKSIKTSYKMSTPN